MTIKLKLFLIGTLVFTGFAMTTTATIISTRNMQNLNNVTIQGRDLMNGFLQVSSLSKDMLSTGNLGTTLQNWKSNWNAFVLKYEDFISSPLTIALLSSEEGVALIKSLSDTWDVLQLNAAKVASNTQVLVDTYSATTSTVPGLMMGATQYQDMAYLTAMSNVNTLVMLNNSHLEQLESFLAKFSQVAQSEIKSLILILIASASGITLIIALLFILFARSMIGRLSYISTGMVRLQEKDFSSHLVLRGKDELAGIAATLNGFIDSFSSILNGVKSISKESSILKNEVTSATTETSAAINEMMASIISISERIRDFFVHLENSNREIFNITRNIDILADRIKGQSSFVSRAVSSVEQMAGSIKSVATITTKREKATSNLVGTTRSGGAIIEETATSISDIVVDLDRINEVISIIDGISSQTNLLAMNAAIEAAHAGEAGRGFSVVAEEIRKLADATNENSKSIKAMVRGITSRMAGVLERSQKSRLAFTEVDQEVQATSLAMGEISSAMNELAQGSTEIMESMHELSDIVQELDNETEDMRKHTGHAVEGMKRIEEVSLVIKDGMAEIEDATKDINSAMAHVNNLQLESGESVEKVLREVSGFKTEQPDHQTRLPGTT